MNPTEIRDDIRALEMMTAGAPDGSRVHAVGTVAPRGPLPRDLRSIAISIRQPWAWLIVNRFKPIENRSQPTKQRGRVLIHAQTMTKADYEACLIFVSAISAEIADQIPDFGELHRGGIIGHVSIENCFSPGTLPSHLRDWFTGFYGYELREPGLLPFKPCKGRLGFFPCNYEAL